MLPFSQREHRPTGENLDMHGQRGAIFKRSGVACNKFEKTDDTPGGKHDAAEFSALTVPENSANIIDVDGVGHPIF